MCYFAIIPVHLFHIIAMSFFTYVTRVTRNFLRTLIAPSSSSYNVPTPGRPLLGKRHRPVRIEKAKLVQNYIYNSPGGCLTPDWLRHLHKLGTCLPYYLTIIKNKMEVKIVHYLCWKLARHGLCLFCAIISTWDYLECLFEWITISCFERSSPR